MNLIRIAKIIKSTQLRGFFISQSLKWFLRSAVNIEYASEYFSLHWTLAAQEQKQMLLSPC